MKNFRITPVIFQKRIKSFPGGSSNLLKVFHLLLLAVMCAATTGQVLATAFPGPDAFGYMGKTIPANLRDVSASGTFVPLSDDQTSGVIPIPFTFNFYGVGYNLVSISSNGFIAFTPGTSQGCCTGEPLPQADFVNNVIAGFWEDLNAPQGNIRYQTLGTAPNREFIVGFYGVPHFFSGPRVTFEMILHEGIDSIELQYGAAPSDGGTHSVGIENADGTIGLQVAIGNVSFNNEAFLISLDQFQKNIVSGPDEPDSIDGTAPAPDSITFETLNTTCSAQSAFAFELNGTSLGSTPSDPTFSCICSAPIDSFAVTDSVLIASNWSEPGPNAMRFIKTGGDNATAWSRAVLHFGAITETVCLFDLGGGNCDVTDLCDAAFTFGNVDASADASPFLTPDGIFDAVVEVGQHETTEYDFEIVYRNSDEVPALIKDTVPAEWDVELMDDDGGNATAASANKKNNGKSATKIDWTPDPSGGSITVWAGTRGHKKNGKFRPTSCGALQLNDGAQVFELDPLTGEPLVDTSGDRLPPIFESNQLCLAAVEDVNGDGIIVRDGSGDEDGDGLTDLEESCEIGTDPCVADTDGDTLTDSEEIAAGTDPLNADTDGDNIPDNEDLCPLDELNFCI